jgi:2-phosphosulfolactate phosphatase
LNVDELYFAGKTTVVIDVLRATTVIVTALANSAKEVIPVNTIEFAMKISGNAFGGQTLLCGERNTKMIEGFNFGNSPLQFTSDTVKGKSIVLYTTNGSKAIVRAKHSENLFICCFNNLSSIAKKLIQLRKDVVILCAGSNGMFCLEDTLCAGKLISELDKYNGDIEITDAVKASVVLNESFGKNTEKMLGECEHGSLLIKNGFVDDIKHCSQVNNVDVIPFMSTGTIKLEHSDLSS